jgi:antitoxin MazE
MQVSKWGNSLAVRIPATVVEALGLKEGDEIEITVAGERAFQVESAGRKRRMALDRLKSN